MKKKIVAPFLSAFIIPGLGQLVNGQIAKGSMLLGGVTILFALIVFKVLFDITKALNTIPDPRWGPELAEQVAMALARQSHTVLFLLVLAFGCLWAYSVVDGYRTGKKLDENRS
jgi:TM2 domain-containing membrane protein YozV